LTNLASNYREFGGGTPTRGRHLLLGAVAASGLIASAPALAQPGKIKIPTVEREFNPSLLRYTKLAPIPFKPFVRTDEKGNPIAQKGVVTLPNGKTLPAEQYFRELDASEQYLNEHGYSLRTLPETTPTTIASIPVDEASLRQQLQRAPALTRLAPQTNFAQNFNLDALNATRPIAPNQATAIKLGIPEKLLTPEVLANGNKVAASKLGGTLRSGGIVIFGPVSAQLGTWTTSLHANLICTPFDKTKNWAWNLGNTSTLAVNITGSIGYSGVACPPPPPSGPPDTQTHFTVNAEGNVDGSVYGNTKNLLKVTGSLAGDRSTNKITASLGVIVLGQTIASVNQTYNAHWGVSNTVSRGVDFSSGFYIPIGPFSIHATVGVQGQAGYQYALDLYPTAVGFSATPSVTASGYAQAGLNAIVAEGGIGANFTLVDWKMNVQASAGVGWYYGALAYGNLYADTNTNLLSGNIYVYAKYWTCCHHWVVPYQVQTNYDLYSWSGYHYNSVLFNEQVLIPL
jgi:hypothetical protein